MDTKYTCTNSTIQEKIDEIKSPQGIFAVYNIETNEIFYIMKKNTVDPGSTTVDLSPPSFDHLKINETKFIDHFTDNNSISKEKLSNFIFTKHMEDLQSCLEISKKYSDQSPTLSLIQ